MVTRKSAILFGATGLIGAHLLHELLDSPAYATVKAVVRRDTGIRHPKLSQLFADHRSLVDIKAQLTGDVVFCCVGTTRKRTPDLHEYYRIDHDYPLAAAQYTKDNGASAFLLVSALGANPASKFFYLRTKGETERDIIRLGFEQTHVFRPSLLTGNRREKRGLEALSAIVFRVVNPLLISSLSKYRSIKADWVAKAMCRIGSMGQQGVYTYYGADIKKRL